MNSEEQQQWGSHLAPLLACLASTVGPVLEVGIGYHSTPQLHALCAAAQRELHSLEESEAWFEKLAYLATENRHTFGIGPYDETVVLCAKTKWSVALIDNSPGGERRARDFATLLPVCQFVVVHDYWRENEEAIGPLIDTATVKDWWVCKRYEPPTLVASKFRDVPKVLKAL